MEELRPSAEQWLKAVAYTVATNDIVAHLDLFSRRLKVVGISPHGFLQHDEWTERRRNDMETRRLLRISHEKLKLISHSRRRLTFQIEETLKSTRGEGYVLDKEVMLEQELDDQWRAVSENISSVRPIRSARHDTAAPRSHQPTDGSALL